MSAVASLRPMRADDAPAVHELARRSFGELYPEPPETPERRRGALLRITHLIETDPDGAVVAERSDGTLEGAALALRREGLWGLSLLAVDPGTQSRGTGSRLLAAALATADGARGAIILSSKDPRALRLYARAGFAVHPVLEASGPMRRRPAWPSTVRPGGLEDRPLMERVDRVVRGAAHGPDIEVSLEQGSSLFVLPERGYAAIGDGAVRLLAALDPSAAQDLLRAALAASPPDTEVEVDWLDAGQQWALPVLLEAGLALRPGSAMFRRGEVGTCSPYLPSGAWL